MDTDDCPLLPIGEVAHRAGLSISALHYYERIGLVSAPERISGRRRYDPRILDRLAYIEMAKRAGFTLAEVSELLDGFDQAVPATERWRLLATRKLPEVEALIEQAVAMKRLLEQGLECRRLRLDNQTLFVSSRRSWYPSPFAYERGPGLAHAHLVFDTLLWKDASGGLLPWLAASWGCNDAGTEWRFTLRPGLRWHDGQELTARDVVFSVRYLQDGPGRASPGLVWGLEMIAEVVAESPDRVVFHLHHRCATFEEWIAGRMMVIPEHVWSTVSDPASLRGPAAVMGSGPYRLVAHEEGTGRYLYTANPDYFFGVPYVRRLEFLEVADPLLALLRGDVDVASAAGETNLDEASWRALQDPRYGKISAPGEWVRALHINLTRGFPFDDRRFRLAIAHAIDRAGLVEQVLGGKGEVGATGGMAPSHPDTPRDLPTYPHDVVEAKRLLDELGLSEGGAGGRRLPDGRVFAPELQIPSDADPAVARLVINDLRVVGLDVRPVTLDAPLADNSAAKGCYDLALVGYGSLGGDPDWLRIRLSASVHASTPARVHGYRSSRFEDLASRQLDAADSEERRRLIQEMQRVVAGDVPFVHLYAPARVVYFDRQIFDAWYFTAGGVCGAYPGPLNKHAFITGKKIGLP